MVSGVVKRTRELALAGARTLPAGGLKIKIKIRGVCRSMIFGEAKKNTV
jgi:hypothetical protein